MICESYYQAIRTATPSQIETIDMARAACTTRQRTASRTSQRQGGDRLRHGAALVHARLRAALARLGLKHGGRPSPGRALRLQPERDPIPMAEAIMRHFYGHKVYVTSCGVRPGERDPFVDAVLEEMGIELGRFRPKSFDDLDDSSFDVVVSLSPEAHHKAWS